MFLGVNGDVMGKVRAMGRVMMPSMMLDDAG
jgi:hypothetical protein